MAIRLSYLYNGNSLTGKRATWYWDGPTPLCSAMPSVVMILTKFYGFFSNKLSMTDLNQQWAERFLVCYNSVHFDRNNLFTWGQKDFSIVSWIWWEFHAALIQGVVKWFLLNFAHGTTAELVWPEQDFVAISCPTMELHQNPLSIRFELGWKNRSWNGPLDSILHDVRENRSIIE